MTAPAPGSERARPALEHRRPRRWARPPGYSGPGVEYPRRLTPASRRRARHVAAMGSSVRELAAATPATRDRYVDLLRVASLGTVVLGHWLMAVRHRRTASGNLLAVVPELQILTWALQIMPVFFFVGGFSHALSYRSLRRRQPGGIGLRRLPAGPAPAAAAAHHGVHPGLGQPPRSLVQLAGRGRRADRRRAAAGRAAAVVHRDLSRDGRLHPAAAEAARAIRLGRLRRRSSRRAVARRRAAVRARRALRRVPQLRLRLARRPPARLPARRRPDPRPPPSSPPPGSPGPRCWWRSGRTRCPWSGCPARRSPTWPRPPSPCSATGCGWSARWSCCAGRARAWLARPRVWRAVVAANGVAMTAFLWHLTAMLGVYGALLALDVAAARARDRRLVGAGAPRVSPRRPS